MPECGFSWSISAEAAIRLVEQAPDRFASLLANNNGAPPESVGRWSATSYLWHTLDSAKRARDSAPMSLISVECGGRDETRRVLAAQAERSDSRHGLVLTVAKSGIWCAHGRRHHFCFGMIFDP